MPAKKSAKKSTKTTKTVEKAPKKCNCEEKCECKECKCDCGNRSQVPFYILIAMLVATLTILVISVAFNRSVADIFRPSTYIYNGLFDKEVSENKTDENGFTLLSAGAVVDMVTNDKNGLLIVGEENCLGCDAFARRVASYVEGDTGIYRYDMRLDPEKDDLYAKGILKSEDTPTFLYIAGGEVYDRIDEVKDSANLEVFLKKYLPSEDVEDLED